MRFYHILKKLYFSTALAYFAVLLTFSFTIFYSMHFNLEEQLLAARNPTDELSFAETEISSLNEDVAINPSTYVAMDDSKEQNENFYTVKKGDSLIKVVSNLGFPKKQIIDAIANFPEIKNFVAIREGQKISYFTDKEGKITGILLGLKDHHKYYLRSDNSRMYLMNEKQTLLVETAYAEYRINGSLDISTLRAGLDRKILNQLINIFNHEIDFAKDLRENDRVRILYERHIIDGKKVGSGNIVAAELNNQGRTFKALRYAIKDGKYDYFNEEGISYGRAFLRTPVNYTRISSKFNAQRRHPILHKIRRHKGVDYAAPIGTEVKSTGDGVVKFVGVKNGYGKVIELKHGDKYATLYAHLNNFAKGITYGSKIKKGQIIGYVGKTGLASGPHLHYEFKVDGEHKDPLTVPLPKKKVIDPSIMEEFNYHKQLLFALMQKAQNLQLAKREGQDKDA